MNEHPRLAINSLTKILRSPDSEMMSPQCRMVTPNTWSGSIHCFLEEGTNFDVTITRKLTPGRPLDFLDEERKQIDLGKGWTKGEIDPRELIEFSHLSEGIMVSLGVILSRELQEFIEIVSPAWEILRERGWVVSDIGLPCTQWIKAVGWSSDYLMLSISRTGTGYTIIGESISKTGYISPLEGSESITHIADCLEAELIFPPQESRSPYE
jgi:hypothetical protein